MPGLLLSATMSLVIGRWVRIRLEPDSYVWNKDRLTEDQHRFVVELLEAVDDGRPFSLESYRFLKTSGAAPRVLMAMAVPVLVIGFLLTVLAVRP